jgi:hypothetical protein
MYEAPFWRGEHTFAREEKRDECNSYSVPQYQPSKEDFQRGNNFVIAKALGIEAGIEETKAMAHSGW